MVDELPPGAADESGEPPRERGLIIEVKMRVPEPHVRALFDLCDALDLYPTTLPEALITWVMSVHARTRELPEGLLEHVDASLGRKPMGEAH